MTARREHGGGEDAERRLVAACEAEEQERVDRVRRRLFFGNRGEEDQR